MVWLDLNYKLILLSFYCLAKVLYLAKYKKNSIITLQGGVKIIVFTGVSK